LFQTQLLRLWRSSTNTNHLSQQILVILHSLPFTGIHRILTSTLLNFFKPVNIQRNIWLPYHHLCLKCFNICQLRNFIARKIFDHFDIIISSKLPVSCKSPSVYFILLHPPCNLYFITDATCLHSLLSLLCKSFHSFTQILPFSNKPIYMNDKIFKQVPLKPLFDLLDESQSPKLFLYNIFHNNSSTYGLQSSSKKPQTEFNYFNEYKHATSICEIH
jgi:hypothetical protein